MVSTHCDYVERLHVVENETNLAICTELVG